MVFTDYKVGGKDAYTGNIGGQLIVQNKDKSYFLAAITNWRLNCAKKNRSLYRSF